MSESNNIPSSSELLKKAEAALTPDQYSRMKSKALEKIGFMKLSSMSLDELKSELPGLAKGDKEEKDIMARLDGVFGTSRKAGAEFLKNPIDYIGEQATNAKDAAYDSLVPDQIKSAVDANKRGASTAVVAATTILGTSTGGTLEQAEKAKSCIDTFKENPWEALKELFSIFMGAIQTGDWSKIASIFPFGESISKTLAKGFSEKIGIPKDLLGAATDFFTSDGLKGKTYGDMQKLYEAYKKDSMIDLSKTLGGLSENPAQLSAFLAGIFGKKGPDVSSLFPGIEDTSKIPIVDIMKKFSE